MPVRRRTPSPRRLAGVGVASAIGVASVLGFAPAAHASGTAKANATPSPSGTDSTKASGKPAATAPRVHPTYGLQKYRVGVQIKDGSWVPAGTTTDNTTLTITETGPSAPAPPDNTFQCATAPGSEDPGSTTSWCINPHQQTARLLAKYPGIAPRLHHQPTPGGAPSDEEFTAGAGDKITITQTTVEPNLVIDSSTAVLKRCLANADYPVIGETCANDPNTLFDVKSTDEIFDDGGLPPVAADDSASTDYGKPVVVDELSNDNSQGAPSHVKLTSAPQHGTAHLLSDNKFRYKPAAGFSGADSFRYTLTTANGSATATVTVNVAAPPPSAKDDSASTTRDHGVDIDVTANDNPRGQDITKLGVTSTPHHGTAHVVQTSSGRQIRYTPKAGYLGTDTFHYEITTAGGTATAMVHVDVSAPPPVAVDDSASVDSGKSVTVAVTQNDNANGAPITITSTSDPAHGSVQISGLNVVYTADANYVGPDAFTYTIQNSGGSDTATVHITVSSSGVLADTGVDSAALLQIGGVLLVVGGVSTVAGRRRRRGRHATA